MLNLLRDIYPLLVPLFCIVSISTFLALILKTKITKTFFLAISLIVLILFFSGVLGFRGSLFFGYCIILMFSVFSIIFSIRKLVNERDKIKEISLWFGISIFLMFILFALFLNYNRMFSEWDEFSYWGSVVKGMFSIDSLATHKDSTLLIESYIPGMPLLQYFFTRSFKQFVEFPSFIALNTFFFSLIITFIEKINLKNFLFLVAALTIPMFGSVNFFSSLYVDTLLGVLLGCNILVYYYYNHRNNLKMNIITLTAISSMLTLTKDMGLIFAIITISIIFTDALIFNRKFLKSFLKNKNTPRKFLNLMFLLSPLLVTVLIQIIWRIHLHMIGITSTLQVAGNSFFSILKDRGLEPFQVDIIHNFLSSLKNQAIYPLNLTFAQIIIFYVCIVLVLILTSLYIKKRDKIRLALTFFLILIGNAIYLGILLYSYLFIFGQYEGLRLASYNRYMLSYIIGLLFSILIFLLFEGKPQKIPQKTNLIKELCLIINVLIWFVFFNYLINNIKPFIKLNILSARDSVQSSIEMRKPFEKIKEWSEYKNEKIYIISQGDQGLNKLILMHNIYPSNIEWIRDYSVSTTPYYPELDDPWTMIISPEDWGTYVIKNYDLLYLFNYDDNFTKLYGHYFDNLTQYQLYRVDATNGSLKLISIEK